MPADKIGGVPIGKDARPLQTKTDAEVRETLAAASATATEEPPAEKEEEKDPVQQRAERKARLAEVMFRGIVNAQLSVPLPKDRHGVWVHRDQMEIAYYEALGYKVDDQFALKNAIHNDGSGKPIVGDTIFMTCSKEQKELIDEVNRDQYMRNNTKSGQAQLEEKQFKELLDKKLNRGTDSKVPAIIESQEVEVSKSQIAAALQAGRNE